MNDGDSVVTHVLAFDVLSQLFLSLPEKYDPLVTALQNMDYGKLNLNVAKERLILEEAKLSDRNEEVQDDKTVFSGKKFQRKNKFFGKCFKCNKFGHLAKNCR